MTRRDLHKLVKEAIVEIKQEELQQKGKLYKASIPKDMSKKKFKDVIDGSQVELVDNTGKRFGTTSERENYTVFYTNGNKTRELLKQVGEEEFIKQLENFYNIKVKEVM